MASSWAGAERTSLGMSGDETVAGAVVIAGGAVIGGCAMTGFVTSAGRAVASSGPGRFASMLASAARTRASNGFR